MSGLSFLDAYVRRVVDDELDDLFPQLPAILLDGPKAIGKTATALQRAATVRRLDDPAERAVMEAQPLLIAGDERPVVLDEYQRAAGAWDAVRRLVDDDKTGGQYLLTGSEPRGETHSGAARITTVRMRPLTLAERGVGTPTVSLADLLAGTAAIEGRSTVGLEEYVDEIVSGGFPGLRHLSGRALHRQLDGYVERIVERDLPEAGFTVRRPAAARAWMRAYAAATSTTASWEKVRDAATSGVTDKPARRTTSVYTDLLVSLRILDPVEAWLPTYNHLHRLTAFPKHHLCDPALAVRLLGLTKAHLLRGEEGHVSVPRDGTFLGALFESLATLSVRVFAQSADATTRHLRTDAGRHEVDLIVEQEGRILAFEVKLSGTVNDNDVKHLTWLRTPLGDDLVDAAVLTTGAEAYRRADGIAVIPLALLGP